MIKVDQFSLAQSKKFSLEPTEEIRVDLHLKRKSCLPETKIVGQVTHNSIPIPNATVKVLDLRFNPVAHTVTNASGTYSIENLKPGYYKLTATAKGFLTANTIDFSLKRKETQIINFELKADLCSSECNFIYGTITILTTDTIIQDADIKLFSTDSEIPNAITTSNESGEYLFCDISPGDYSIIAIKAGFLPSNPIRLTLSAGQLVKIPIQLQADYKNSFGTISGIIKDLNCYILNGAYVGLFRTDNSRETLMQITKTNFEGLYLFSDVQQGEYIVKAMMQEKWDYCRAFKVI